jgi:glycosyltransferase involved in cell wall biosynthesis
VAPEVEAVSNAIRTMLSDTALYAKLKEGSKRLTGQLDWEQLAAQMEDAYQAVSPDLRKPACPH